MNELLLASTIAFNIGLVVGAGIGWALVMYRWEPIESIEEKL